jgi:hypothetical protein
MVLGTQVIQLGGNSIKTLCVVNFLGILMIPDTESRVCRFILIYFRACIFIHVELCLTTFESCLYGFSLLRFLIDGGGCDM